MRHTLPDDWAAVLSAVFGGHFRMMDFYFEKGLSAAPETARGPLLRCANI
jgi:hypothetical protein